MTYRRKLIEVSLPLEAINKESAREKSIRHGHPSTLHLWWARRPLAACRAVLWSSLVDDPSEYMPDEKSANEERERLFKILENLVLWKNINNEEVLDKARLEIARSVARDLGVDEPVGKEAIREFLATKAPPVLDPFAGGGSIPLEAQRLGLRAYASDLNPVAVLINKAMIEIPPKFAGMPPVHPANSDQSTVTSGKKKAGQAELWQREWRGAQGLAEDVRYYGQWMRDEAFKRIGHLYPKAKIAAELLAERPDLKAQGLKPGDELTVIAWLWARTVKCPNPACGAQMPLATDFMLSTKKGKEAWIEPIVESKRIHFTVKTGTGTPTASPKIGRGAQFRCLICNQIAPEENIRSEFKAKRANAQMMAIVADTGRERIYLPPHEYHVQIAMSAKPTWTLDEEMNQDTPNLVSGRGYGFTHWRELFTNRQIVTLTLYCDLINDVRNLILKDGKSIQDRKIENYANAISTYLVFAIDKMLDTNTSFCSWQIDPPRLRSTFGRQALPMVWDYAESNTFGEVAGDYKLTVGSLCEVLDRFSSHGVAGIAEQIDATSPHQEKTYIFSTDPPYYDNIGYADLSDFFYIWIRKTLAHIYPELFATMLVPKTSELVATPYRFGGDRHKAENFFETGLRNVFRNMCKSVNSSVPVSIFYAFKQSETDEVDTTDNQTTLLENRASTGWETMLSGLIESGFEITGTWPVRSEMASRNIGRDTNALASSIVLVCRPRPSDAGNLTRREFLAALKKELPPALRRLQLGSIAPVDLAQAAIGPGMAVYSRYQAVLESDGSPMRVRTALALINQALDEYLTEQEGEYDGDTRWALAWYEQFGHNEAPYGVAETLSKAKNTSVEGLAEAGILEARAGKVRLLRRDELEPSWNPEKDKRLTAWESVQHLIFALDQKGEEAAAALLSHLGGLSETARDLAYRLYTVCERKGWAQDALAYNMLVVAWPRLKELASRQEPAQEKLL
jgi:putative DNA methylase